MAAYYNEADPFAAQWLRNLIAAGHIAPGEVDERDIRDVSPTDLVRFRQCHFFAGIGGWSRALRLAGIHDDMPVWTGSCPCQPFSVIGKRQGTGDERHLWPEWRRLIDERRPIRIYGEQVSSVDGLEWLDVVLSDLERSGYAVAAADLCAASIGAPHIRARLWLTAARRLADAEFAGLERHAGNGNRAPRREKPARPIAEGGTPCDFCGFVFDRDSLGRYGCPNCLGEGLDEDPADYADAAVADVRGFWAGADWIDCRDGKARPVEPGTFPLANGIPGRVGRLRAYGNAIVPQVAAEFVRATL